MPHANLTRALADDGCALGAWVSLDAEGVPQLLDRAGYDFIGFDCQHGTLSETDAARHVRRMQHADAALLVRVSANQPALIGRVLDAGADGVVVPLVSTADEARLAVRACQYPPHGVRSFGPNRADLPMQPDALAARVSCFVMIETGEGLENADEICAVPGLSGIVIGPGDLSIGLGMAPMGGFTTNQLDEPLSRIHAACEKNGIVLGAFVGSLTRASSWIDRGVRLLIGSSDLGLLAEAAARDLKAGRDAASGSASGEDAVAAPTSPYR